MIELENNIFKVNDDNFEDTTFQVFEYQYKNCKIYNEYINLIDKKKPSSLKEIPFLPITFFKTQIINTQNSYQQEFLSSGTTTTLRSKHQIYNLLMYEKSFEKHYRTCIGNPEEQIIFALLPNYIEQGNSSLVYMLNFLINKSKHKFSGFYLHENELLLKIVESLKNNKKKIVLFGVSYALLDLAEKKPDFSELLIIETGGMKGKRKEMSKTELHEHLKKAFHSPKIFSEYGMTELLSQSYSTDNELFISPPWKKVFIRDSNDPFHYLENGKTGGINIIDLANLYSCSFIETEDIGKSYVDKFQVLGRMDTSEVRGCNLLYFDK